MSWLIRKHEDLQVAMKSLFMHFPHFLSAFKEINECTVNPGICGEGVCLNLPEGYACKCNDGYNITEQQHKCVGKRYFQQSKLLISNICLFRIYFWYVILTILGKHHCV